MTGWQCSPETLLRYSWDKTLRKAELRLHLLPGNGSLPAGFLQGRANVLQILLVFQLLEALQILNRHHGRDGLSAAAQHDSFTTADALQKTVSRGQEPAGPCRRMRGCRRFSGSGRIGFSSIPETGTSPATCISSGRGTVASSGSIL